MAERSSARISSKNVAPSASRAGVRLLASVVAACARGNACCEGVAIAAPEIPQGFPAYLVANTTWQWEQVLYAIDPNDGSTTEFAADDGGTVTLYLSGQSSIKFTATAQAATDDWLFSVAATTTDDVVAGPYAWRMIGVLSGVSYDLGSGQITVFSNPDTTNGTDRRTHAQKMVPLIEAEIEARLGGTAGSGHNSYTLLGRSIDKFTLAELMNLLAQYEARAERDVRGRPKPFHVHFGLSRQ